MPAMPTCATFATTLAVTTTNACPSAFPQPSPRSLIPPYRELARRMPRPKSRRTITDTLPQNESIAWQA